MRIAVNGAEALQAVRESRPHLIISDVVMPVMDGYAMCRAIKDDETLSDVPVIILTSLSDPQDVILGVEAGVDYYLTKPYQAEALLSEIEAVLASSPYRETDDAQEQFRVTIAGKTAPGAIQQAADCSPCCFPPTRVPCGTTRSSSKRRRSWRF